MISNPIDSISNPGFDLSNTMDLGPKPLGGISDPTKHYDEETKTWVDDVLETDESKIICYNRDGYVIQNS